ncbi:unnamed protein product [Symbiodinium sp. KB8]|nr:unnamed protein product [Symbiodinium sp. KB8]
MFERMLQAVAAKSNASTGSEGLDSRDLLRLLPKPEVFKVGPKGDEHQAWLTWWWQTRQYLVALDHRFDSDLKTIEENLNHEVILSSADPPGTVIRSQQLYSILCSLLKGKALSIVRQTDNQRGYEALRLLLMQYQPPSKVRSLGILSALTTIKSFDHKQPVLPQLLELERAFEEYQRASGEPVQESLKSALLLRSISASMRAHIAASMDENASYSTLRECVLKFERTQFKWTGMHVFSPDGLFASSSADPNGPQPMDIDAVSKGKGKKGKKGQWNQQGQNQWNQYKGDKGKGDKGKHQHNWQANQWQYHGKGYGSVSQVSGDSTAMPASPSPSPAPSTVGGGASQVQGSVRRVDFDDGLVFDMTGFDDRSLQFHVQTVTVESASGHVAVVCDSENSSSETNRNHLQSGPSNEADLYVSAGPDASLQHSVRAVCRDVETVIVDSGADLSCVPLCYSSAGQKVANASAPNVRDAQGGKMRVSSQRNIQFQVSGRDGRSITLREKCIATSEDPPESAADAVAGASDDFPMGHEPEEFAPVPPAPPSDAFEPPPERPRVQDQQVIVDGIALTPLSTLGALRAACEKLGLSKSGSKQRCYDRLKGYVEKQKLSAEVEVAQHGASASSRDPNLQPVPQPPSREAQLLHECTHLPYAPWCNAS